MKTNGKTHSLPGSGPLTVVQPFGGGGGEVVVVDVVEVALVVVIVVVVVVVEVVVEVVGGGGGGGGGPGVLGHSLDPVVESIQLLTTKHQDLLMF